MYTTPAQWAVDPMLPGACACSGILLLAVILIIACMAVVRRKSAKHTGLRWLAITLLAIVSLVWLALAIDQFMFEPRFDDTYAFAAVSDLPEVKAYLDDGAARGIDREVVTSSWS